MNDPSSYRNMIGSAPSPLQGLPLTEPSTRPHGDAEGISEGLIRDVVVEFYKRVLQDERLGPVFETHIASWDDHLARMTDFWSAALLRTGRYAGRPVERHRTIEGLGEAHFERWLAMFEATVDDLCAPRYAKAFVVRAHRMREAMTRVLGLDSRP